MRIVLDTNVLISGMINPTGPPGRIIDLMRNGVLKLVVDDRILSEYADVLRRKYFARYFDKTDVEDIIDYLFKNSHYATSRVIIHHMPDKADIPFIEMAITETVPLVTGNLRHFPAKNRRGCAVLSPAQFIKTVPDTV
ncbi:Nucleic acid-binding protein contains PIN domain-like protein [uncultured Desulfobacterium sp.]|uniref:Nucleic acid-binding protein contains PIN domain-like protein n=1 Tax=uncultured Desulfobacterium sp. TaxID=201089 RepID=A0A445N089_9BACT|nr:Nucleic acid-binding protein contains PIN domain-like protein [uncultured Desulfobacterium sp.]